MTLTTKDIKILQKFTTEPDEFKRYILLQLWISQLFSTTLTEPVTVFKEAITKYNSDNNVNNSANVNPESELYYDCFKNIKKQLMIKVQQYEKVHSEMLSQYKLIKIMDTVLNINSAEPLQKQLTNLSTMISKYNDYIKRLNNLSEAEISSILKNVDVN